MRLIVWICVGFLPAFSASAQVHEDILPASHLSFVSKTMYDEGNINYLVVDALRDSLLRLGKPYTVMIKTPDHLRVMIPGETRIENQPKMSVSLQQQYLAKFEKFLELHKEENGGFVVIKADSPLTRSIIENPGSTFRSSVEVGRYRAGLETVGKRNLVLQMLRDKIITLDDKTFELVYSADGITVNEVPLQGAALDKYKNHFRDRLGIDLDNGRQSGRWFYDKGVADAVK